MSFEMLHYVGG